jgi:hypothetical protein
MPHPMSVMRARCVVDVRSRTCRLPSNAGALVFLLALLFLTPTWLNDAHAEKADRQKEITYSGDHINANIAAKGGDLSGNVVIVQGTLEIHADRVVFRQNDDDTLSATAYGSPVTFREKRDDSDMSMKARHSAWCTTVEKDWWNCSIKPCSSNLTLLFEATIFRTTRIRIPLKRRGNQIFMPRRLTIYP